MRLTNAQQILQPVLPRCPEIGGLLRTGRNKLDEPCVGSQMYLLVLHRCAMKIVSARQANHEFSALLSRAERGEEILIAKRSKPVAVLRPYRSPAMTAERQKAIQHAIAVMTKGLFWGDSLRRFTREDMHDRP